MGVAGEKGKVCWHGDSYEDRWGWVLADHELAGSFASRRARGSFRRMDDRGVALRKRLSGASDGMVWILFLLEETG
jgi:hypothetical protein